MLDPDVGEVGDSLDSGVVGSGCVVVALDMLSVAEDTAEVAESEPESPDCDRDTFEYVPSI